MTKTELVERIIELKMEMALEFRRTSSKADDLYYALKHDILDNYDDITEDRSGS